MLQGQVQKLVIVISGLRTGAVLERWSFNIETTLPAPGQFAPSPTLPTHSLYTPHPPLDPTHPTQHRTVEKPLAEIQAEIRAIIRQITASVTFLPLIEEPCSFEMLVYTDQDVVVPPAWADTDAHAIDCSQEVRLRSFSTKIHKVDTAVSYRVPEML